MSKDLPPDENQNTSGISYYHALRMLLDASGQEGRIQIEEEDWTMLKKMTLEEFQIFSRMVFVQGRAFQMLITQEKLLGIPPEDIYERH